VFLSAAAARTRRIKIITGCVLPVFNHPVRLAEETAMLDVISNGRLEVGIARAFLPNEFHTFNISLDESRARFEEGIEALKALWTRENVTMEGRFHTFYDATILPRPIQKPHPPIWIAAVVTPESFVWAGKQGYKLMCVPYIGDFHELAEKLEMYRRAYLEAGHPPDQMEIMMVFHLYLAENSKAAREECEAYINRYMEVFIESASWWTGRSSSNYAQYSQIEALLRGLPYDRVYNENRAWIGTPDEVHERMEAATKIFGPIYPTFQINFGGMDLARARRSVELFARHLMPEWRKRAV
jgi:alkanesulfonate monooxygenase SsuD/methylene tetrahydromethanopterin reductase-like flavin-dependent oxidoreductase (luciferase family)